MYICSSGDLITMNTGFLQVSKEYGSASQQRHSLQGWLEPHRKVSLNKVHKLCRVLNFSTVWQID